MSLLSLGVSLGLVLMSPSFSCMESVSCERCADQDIDRQIQGIDRSLEALNQQRLLYQARALWHSDKGMRLQNRKGYNLEARRAYKEAELEWGAVKMIEERMAVLRKQRAELILRREQ